MKLAVLFIILLSAPAMAQMSDTGSNTLGISAATAASQIKLPIAVITGAVFHEAKSAKAKAADIVYCAANNVHDGGQTLHLQVFASVFLTEPAGGSPDANMYGEMQDISTVVGQNTLKKQRNEAQLYR
ncbi:hypothetical protein EN816_14210 [Mesorhizobium sp. M8A.F.Ca.ET.173.01.1.1]|uniref:hypothetical protein n=1 Tax=Mesorhizobium sp. M8A.F.Ca.ET.207.01.1.1 TaxID=2563968 RepID=UPI00109227FB|nr:hypothetical protein [Mesorhizobium sp. M8A.F.Ca.ET.207.01.1.1]TGQ79916.1 hypothetical protein EN850_17870 [Mesorhizobium sp. M8A.F.Ca.ET.207.01.1.1]TGV14138.1 hypothetical protein EN816_14210 [Mesorhizobium sp. M8A.F.Ca.ET.173.01.1.1]TIT68094.1 MAG: hypothetical protein E5W90_05675 [Mesorhizobium sp.]